MGDGLHNLEGRLVQATLGLAEIRVADVAQLGQLAQQGPPVASVPDVRAEDVGVRV